MKRWIVIAFIVIYLFSLGGGLLAHTMNFGTGSHPMMYFFVWDMFCDWSAFSNRTYVIGEGESGRYYELAPGPWKEFTPHGDMGRQHYDCYGVHASKIGVNTLKHTQHEPMARIFVVEETWAKKYNMPDALWSKRFEEPKDVHKYYHLLSILTPDGKILRSQPNWLSYQYNLSISRNPRLHAEAKSLRPMFFSSPTDMRNARRQTGIENSLLQSHSSAAGNAN